MHLAVRKSEKDLRNRLNISDRRRSEWREDSADRHHGGLQKTGEKPSVVLKILCTWLLWRFAANNLLTLHLSDMTHNPSLTCRKLPTRFLSLTCLKRFCAQAFPLLGKLNSLTLHDAETTPSNRLSRPSFPSLQYLTKTKMLVIFLCIFCLHLKERDYSGNYKKIINVRRV